MTRWGEACENALVTKRLKTSKTNTNKKRNRIKASGPFSLMEISIMQQFAALSLHNSISFGIRPFGVSMDLRPTMKMKMARTNIEWVAQVSLLRPGCSGRTDF